MESDDSGSASNRDKRHETADESGKVVTFDPKPPAISAEPSLAFLATETLHPGEFLSQRPVTSSTSSRHIDLSTGQVSQRVQTVLAIDYDEAGEGSRWTRLKQAWHALQQQKQRQHKTAGAAGADSILTGSADSLSKDESKTGSAAADGNENVRFDADQEPLNVDQILSEHLDGDKPKTQPHQYRIRSSNNGESLINLFESPMVANYVSAYLRWSFQSSFGQLFVSLSLMFVALIVGFAGFVYAIGQNQPRCISAGGTEFDGAKFMDAFHLSWTTLSTVGYGVISPKVGERRCIGINIVMAYEAFCGVLFGSVTVAIVFAKVARIQGVAQVRFSQPILVRYGLGVMQTQRRNDDSRSVSNGTGHDDSSSLSESSDNLPCPVLEFRILNELSYARGGEILNAAVNIVASTLGTIDEADVNLHLHRSAWGRPNNSRSIRSTPLRPSDSIRDGALPPTSVMDSSTFGSQRSSDNDSFHNPATSFFGTATDLIGATGHAMLGASKAATQSAGTALQRFHHAMLHTSHAVPGIDQADNVQPLSSAELEKEVDEEFERRLVEKLVQNDSIDTILRRQRSMVVSEGNDKVAPRRVFHKLDSETDSHPFFKRVWNIRHVLDQHSPLLSNEAKRLVIANNGYWPEELNDYMKVRKHINFHEVIVSFSGTSNASGAAVYSQKVYDYADMNIGYTFATVLHVEDGYLKVDGALLNDVREQNGGGGEPFRSCITEPTFVLDLATQMAAESAAAATETAREITDEVEQLGAGVLQHMGVTVRGATVYTSETVTKVVHPQSGEEQLVHDDLRIELDHERSEDRDEEAAESEAHL